MSPENTPACLRCGESMKEGAIFDSAGGQCGWMSGLPRKGLTFSKGLKPLPVTSFRCPKCGYLEFFAPSNWER
jgi:hypothetical protein